MKAALRIGTGDLTTPVAADANPYGEARRGPRGPLLAGAVAAGVLMFGIGVYAVMRTPAPTIATAPAPSPGGWIWPLLRWREYEPVISDGWGSPRDGGRRTHRGADLMYRLRVVPIYLPPLRARVGDVALLAQRLIESLNETGGRRVARIAEGGDTVLEISDTPGFLVDSNAPPPPPGVTPRPHPFLSGGCAPGTGVACTRAGNELRASRSLDEFLGRLRDSGFSVQQVAP